jgi:dCMP deaminase
MVQKETPLTKHASGVAEASSPGPALGALAAGDIEFMNLARSVAKRSGDRSTKVGCVIVGPDNRVRVTGYNNFPDGVAVDVPERHERPEKYFWIEHAERNAIYNAARGGVSLSACRAYLPWFPCMDCARGLVQVGIVELVAIRPDLNDPRWGEDFKRVGTLLEEAGVRLRFMEAS